VFSLVEKKFLSLTILNVHRFYGHHNFKDLQFGNKNVSLSALLMAPPKPF